MNEITSTNEMIERVARALCDYVPICDRCKSKARAAIEAMRKPTDQLINEMYKCETGHYDVKQAWSNFIDVCLNDPTQINTPDPYVP